LTSTDYPNTPALRKIRFWLSFVAGLLGFGEMILLGGYAFGGNRLVQMVGFGLGLGIALSWLIWRWAIWRDRLPRTGLEWGLALGLLAVLLSLLLSPDPRQGVWRAGWLLAYALLFYFFIDLLETDIDRWGVLAGLAAAVALVLLQATAEAMQWYRLWFEAAGGFELPTNQYRFMGILMSSPTMALANLLVFAVMVAFWRTQRPVMRIAAAFWLVLYFFALPFSSSRSGWVGLAAGLAFGFCLWSWETRPWRALRAWSRTRLVWSAIGLLVLALVAGLLAVQFMKVFASSLTHGGDPFGTSGREQFITAAVSMWKNTPWLGVGPGRYAFEYLRVASGAPPGFWPAQAHNIFFQVLAEFGILGLAAWLLILILSLRWGCKIYRQTLPAMRLWVGAILAGLAALSVQLLFDDLTQWMAVSVPAVFLLAWIGTNFQGSVQRFPHVSLGWLAIPTCILIGAAGWGLWANQPFAGWLPPAMTGDWRQSAQMASESARRDPAFHFYQTQAGLLWAWEWHYQKDPVGLENARFHLWQALLIEPSTSWNWANLAILDAAAGDLPVAIAHMQTAVQLSPNMALYALNLGKLLEQTGQFEQARLSYRNAIEQTPVWSELSFWNETAFRRATLPALTPTSPAVPGTLWQQARLATLAGHLEDAAHCLARSHLIGESEIEIARVAALLAEARGDSSAVHAARQRQTQLALQDQMQIDPGVTLFYPAFVSNLDGTGISAVPGLIPWSGPGE